MKLNGKTALVTGAGGGLGQGIVLSLARAGADIALADLNLETVQKVQSQLEDLGRKTSAITVDVTQWDQVQAMFEKGEKDLGKIDIVVNNAGVVVSSFVENLEEKDWDRMMNINAKGVFLCCKAALPYLRKNGGGSIINVSSIAGKTGNMTMAGYCASKFAVIGFTQSLAKEVAREDITVNAICPGIIRTAMWDYLAELFKRPDETIEESWQRSVESTIPQGRAQTPEDIGELAVYIASAPNLTGQAINIDGGIVMH